MAEVPKTLPERETSSPIQTPEQIAANNKLLDDYHKAAGKANTLGTTELVKSQEEARNLINGNGLGLTDFSNKKPDAVKEAFRLSQQAPQVANTTVDPSVKKQIEQANTQIQSLVQNPNQVNFNETFDKAIALFPKKMQDFIKSFLNIFGFNFPEDSASKEATKANFDKVFGDKLELKQEFEKYNTKLSEGANGQTKIEFPGSGKITGTHETKIKGTDGKDKTETKPITENTDKIITLGDGAKITSAETKVDSNLTIKVTNKDGSVDAYMVESPKKVETAKAENPSPAPNPATTPV